jgi:hypothetical protein
VGAENSSRVRPKRPDHLLLLRCWDGRCTQRSPNTSVNTLTAQPCRVPRWICSTPQSLPGGDLAAPQRQRGHGTGIKAVNSVCLPVGRPWGLLACPGSGAHRGRYTRLLLCWPRRGPRAGKTIRNVRGHSASRIDPRSAITPHMCEDNCRVCAACSVGQDCHSRGCLLRQIISSTHRHHPRGPQHHPITRPAPAVTQSPRGRALSAACCAGALSAAACF